MKRLKILACKVLYREISFLSSKCENIIDVTYLKQGLHDTPELLHNALKDEIERIDAGTDLYSFAPNGNWDFDAILLGYGLCAKSICGLSSTKYKLVIPRAHDCIALFIGSKDKFKQYFDEHRGGVFWYTWGWNENFLMPGKERVEYNRVKYVEQFGEENADYLMEMEQTWMKEYNLCTYVDWEELHNEDYIQYTRECADYLNWDFDLMKGETGLIEDFINGNWDNEKFLVVEPGQTVEQSFDDAILVAKPLE